MPITEEKKRAAAKLLAARMASKAKPAEQSVLDKGLHAAKIIAEGTGIVPVRIRHSVGRGGSNQAEDLEAVKARLAFLGYDTGNSMDGLTSAIEKYQKEVVGIRHPDGRIDVGGKTIAALVSGTTKTTHKKAAAAKPIDKGGARTSEAATPALSADLPEMIKALRNPAVDAAAAKLQELEQVYHSAKRFRGADGTAHGEMSGADREKVVAEIAELRKMVTGLATAGIPAKDVHALQATFYRAIDLVSPFFYQHNNAVLEYSTERGQSKDLFRSCNITSLAMCLQALGKAPNSYDQPARLARIRAFFHGELDKALELTNHDLSGYRMPDVVGMAALAENLNTATPTQKDLEAAEGKALEWVLYTKNLKALAVHFGVDGRTGEYARSGTLEKFGKKRSEDINKERVAKKKYTEADVGYSDAEMEAELPIAKLKGDILNLMGPVLDSGKQIVVGQYHHFVRLESVTDGYVIKDDPGHWTGADNKITWEEARKIGLFENYLILG
jgi:hypothetical protein